MSLHFGVGTGTGVRAVYQSKAREAGQRGLYLRPRPFYGRVQVHRIRPTNTVPGALRLSESPARSFTQELRAQGQLSGEAVADQSMGVVPAPIFRRGREC